MQFCAHAIFVEPMRLRLRGTAKQGLEKAAGKILGGN